MNECYYIYGWTQRFLAIILKWWLNQTKQQARHLAWHAEILTIRDNAIHFNRFTLNNLPIWKFAKNPKFDFSKFIKNNWYHANGELRSFIHMVKSKEFIHSLKSKKNNILLSPYWLLEQKGSCRRFIYMFSVYNFNTPHTRKSSFKTEEKVRKFNWLRGNTKKWHWGGISLTCLLCL